jgi:AcrR family transcriptional regulator
MTEQERNRGRDGYHHGDLREALIQGALGLIAARGLAGFAIAELARVVGVSSAAPYRHFRDRDAVVAEVARRGFESLASDMDAAIQSAGKDVIAALERCAQAHLAFAKREHAVYGVMFDPHFPIGNHLELTAAREAAFRVLRRAAQEACNRSEAPRRPPPLMVALHVWSMTHGIANLFLGPNATSQLAIPPSELLEAGLLVYLASLGLRSGA